MNRKGWQSETTATLSVLYGSVVGVSDSDEAVFDPDDEDSGEVSGQCGEGDPLEVPGEVDPFESHGDDTCGGADDQEASADSGAEGEQMPEEPVLDERLGECGVGIGGHGGGIGHGIHAHAGGDERDVVDDRREDSDDAGYCECFVDVPVEPVGHVGEDSGGLEGSDGHEDSEEEEDRGHVDVLEDLGDPRLDRLLHVSDAPFAVADEFGEDPHDSQGDHHAHVWGKVCDAFEQGHEEEAEDSDDEHEFSESGSDVLGIWSWAFVGDGLCVVVCDVPGCDEGWDHDGDHTGDQQVCGEVCGRDIAAHPEHDGGDVSDRGPGSSAVGGDDDHAGEDPAFGFVGDESSEHHDHDDGGGHVVEGCGHEEGNEGDEPEEFSFVSGRDVFGDHGESAIGVDQVDDGHGSDEEYEDFAGIAELVDEFVLDFGVVPEEAE